ncbi:MAG: 50S ribosomal protein L10 [Lachnospiraceae bacterium]|nr:50S ribosomal protein L10 [Lachnospiraceae bacterium]
MAKVELKQPVVQEVSSIIDGAKSMVLVVYRGITVDQDTKLRKELREAGITYKVFKNTLVKRAIAGTEFEGLSDDLTGPLAIAVSKDDATAPARILAKYVKDIEVFNMKSGIVDGTYYDEKGMNVIASIPGREVLLSRFLGSIKSPITNFARVMNQLAEKGGASACEAPAASAPAEEAPAETPAEAPAAEAPAEAPTAE